GWPYVQHRGGPLGFLRMLDDRTLAFADFRGNRQYITLGNLAASDRACLFLMDYRRRARLKIYAHAEMRDLTADPDLAERLAMPAYRGRAERAFVLKLVAFDWNCQAHITPSITVVIFPAYSHLRHHGSEIMDDGWFGRGDAGAVGVLVAHRQGADQARVPAGPHGRRGRA